MRRSAIVCAIAGATTPLRRDSPREKNFAQNGFRAPFDGLGEVQNARIGAKSIRTATLRRSVYGLRAA